MCHHRRTCFLILGVLGLILEPLGADIPACIGRLEEMVAVLEETPLGGYDFGQPGGAGIVSFNGVKTESITFRSNQRIETILPDGASRPAARVSRPIPLPTIEAEVDRTGLPA